MVVRMSNTFGRPEIVGRIDPTLLRDIGRQFPNQDTYGQVTRTEHRQNPGLCQALGSFTTWIWQRYPKAGAIEYTIDTNPVPKDRSQRNAVWHADYAGSLITLLAANALPSQFLEIDHTKPIDAATEKIRKGRLLLPNNIRDSEIGDLGLKIFDPEPLAIVAMQDHIHRSTPNTTGGVVKRVWLRAHVFKTARNLPH